MSRVENLRARLAVPEPVLLEIIDENHRHAGHLGTCGGVWWAFCAVHRLDAVHREE